MAKEKTSVTILGEGVRFSVKTKILLLIFILLSVSIGGFSKFATDQFIDDKSAYIYDSNFNHLETFSKNVKSIIDETTSKVITLAFIYQTSPDSLQQLFAINKSILHFAIYDNSTEVLELKAALTNEEKIKGRDSDGLERYLRGVVEPIKEPLQLFQTNDFQSITAFGVRIKNDQY